MNRNLQIGSNPHEAQKKDAGRMDMANFRVNHDRSIGRHFAYHEMNPVQRKILAQNRTEFLIRLNLQ
jgi:hypothetical protein